MDKAALLKQYFSLKSPSFLLEVTLALIVCISAARRAIDDIGSFKCALLELLIRNFRLDF